MVHCPDCHATLESPEAVEFVDMETDSGIFEVTKRFYIAACADCGAAIGSGVAGGRG